MKIRNLEIDVRDRRRGIILEILDFFDEYEKMFTNLSYICFFIVGHFHLHQKVSQSSNAIFVGNPKDIDR